MGCFLSMGSFVLRCESLSDWTCTKKYCRNSDNLDFHNSLSLQGVKICKGEGIYFLLLKIVRFETNLVSKKANKNSQSSVVP